MHRRAIYYQGRLVRLVRGQQAIEAARQGAPLLVFNDQKGWVRGGSGALQRAEQALAEGWWQAVSYYGALVDVSPPTKNPWTPPGAFWPRYELKIMPAESYMHSGKRIIIKWRVVKWTFDPDSPRPIEEEVGFARNFGDAEQVAFKYADKLHDKEPRNPNDIRVFNDQGRCIWSLQGLC